MRDHPLRGGAHHRRRAARAGLAVVLLALWAGGGCGRNTSYIPPAATAREALEAALTAWQNGQAMGKIDTVSPPVQVVDIDWLKGQKLAGYEILEEEARDDGNRGFTVRLQLDQTQDAPVVRYVVVGRSPLCVWRQEDFERMAKWEGY
jgi:anaerobic ribonucleoside-triphosphate reductase